MTGYNQVEKRVIEKCTPAQSMQNSVNDECFGETGRNSKFALFLGF